MRVLNMFLRCSITACCCSSKQSLCSSVQYNTNILYVIYTPLGYTYLGDKINFHCRLLRKIYLKGLVCFLFQERIFWIWRKQVNVFIVRCRYFESKKLWDFLVCFLVVKVLIGLKPTLSKLDFKILNTRRLK